MTVWSFFAEVGPLDRMRLSSIFGMVIDWLTKSNVNLLVSVASLVVMSS